MKSGDKVICVDISPNVLTGEIPNLEMNAVYVIKDVEIISFKTCIRLYGVEIPHAPHPYKEYVGYYSKRFRLLDELKSEAAERQSRKEAVGV